MDCTTLIIYEMKNFQSMQTSVKQIILIVNIFRIFFVSISREYY